jgi:hypothetical protein
MAHMMQNRTSTGLPAVSAATVYGNDLGRWCYRGILVVALLCAGSRAVISQESNRSNFSSGRLPAPATDTDPSDSASAKPSFLPPEPLEMGSTATDHRGPGPLFRELPEVTDPVTAPGPVPLHQHHCCPPTGASSGSWHERIKPWLQESHWGYPEYFHERPLGAAVQQAMQTQIANGVQSQQVLYHYDFLTGDDAARLSPRGMYQLAKIIRRMHIVPAPIIVQQSVDHPELDDARRDSVLNAMAEMGVPAVPEMVVIDRPPVPGMSGMESLLIYQNLLQQTLLRGAIGGTGSGQSGSAIGVAPAPLP